MPIKCGELKDWKLKLVLNAFTPAAAADGVFYSSSVICNYCIPLYEKLSLDGILLFTIRILLLLYDVLEGY